VHESLLTNRTASQADVAAIPFGWKGLSSLSLLRGDVRRGEYFQGRFRVSSTGGDVGVAYRTPDGKLYGCHVVTREGEWRWTALPNGLIPYGLHTLPAGFRKAGAALAICEGEWDALAIREWAATLDERPVCSVALPGGATWRTDWRVYCQPFNTVYLVGDGDRAGRAMVDTILSDLPMARYVRLPDGEDARSILQGPNPGLLDERIAEADRVAAIMTSWRREAVS
jgi:hypothetical protein